MEAALEPSHETQPVLPEVRYVLFVSYGNDSIALIQWAQERGLDGVVALFSDTGWAASFWADRVEQGEALARSYGFTPARTQSVGMAELVRRRKGWPRQGIQFCTAELKIGPALAWLDEHDHEGDAVCVVGVRREESANRRGFPEWTESSTAHGLRSLWAPMVALGAAERDALIARAGFAPLPHRSMECFPCVNSNRSDLRLLADDPSRIEEIGRMEADLGFTANGKPRTMFRPYRYMGAVGIREVVRWALSDRGGYEPCATCDGGFCGS